MLSTKKLSALMLVPIMLIIAACTNNDSLEEDSAQDSNAEAEMNYSYL